MTINYTTLLALAKPVTGTETGQWGDVVNDQITSMLEDAIANAATFSVTSGNATLTTANGSTSQARMSTLIITGTPGTTRNVIAPSQAKIYVVINQSNGAVVIKGAATTGVTVGAGQTAQIAWNGSDFVEIGNYVHGNFVINGNLTVNGNTTLGDVVGDTLTVNATSTFNNANLTLNAGTANGVAYLNGSKVLTTGSALTFDGTNLGLGTASPSGASGTTFAVNGGAGQSRLALKNTNSGDASSDGFQIALLADGVNVVYQNRESGYQSWELAGTEQMRLTSTGLGIGTSSPSQKLTVNGSANLAGRGSSFAFMTPDWRLYNTSSGNAFVWDDYTTERMRLDSSGNLGLGVTPSAFGGAYKGFQIGGNPVITGANAPDFCGNAYHDGTSWSYIGSTFAARYSVNANNGGQHAWFNAPSGTAGNAITFTQAMMLDASGNLGIGTSTFAYASSGRGLIQVNGSTTAFYGLSVAGTGVGYLAGASGNIELGATGFTTFVTNGSERARIDSSGNLLVGATSGNGERLDVNGSGRIRNDLSVYSTTSDRLLITPQTAGNGVLIRATNNANSAFAPLLLDGSHLAFETSDTERARIDSSGNLLVGTTSGITSGGVVIQPVSGQSTIYIGHITGTGSGASYEEYYYAGTKIGSITQSGTTAVLYNVTSDQRLKENIQDAAPASALIDSLQVRQYDWKADGNHQRYGFVAQELVTVAPEAVHQPTDPEEMMGVDYSKLVPMLVKEIQSLRQRVAQLEGK